MEGKDLSAFTHIEKEEFSRLDLSTPVCKVRGRFFEQGLMMGVDPLCRSMFWEWLSYGELENPGKAHWTRMAFEERT